MRLVRLLDRSRLIALPPLLALAPLVAHRALRQSRRFFDERGGFARAEREETAWAAHWAERNPTLASWLERPGAGSLWLGSTTAARWARRACTPADESYAAEVVAGRIPLLGARPDVGNPPAWRRDGYSQQEWPLEPASRLAIVRGDGSDVRTVWELGRCYHFVPLARAYWQSGNAGYLEAFRAHVESWLRENPVGLGPGWCSPMDAAIRGANWAVAALLFAPAPALGTDFWGSLLANLRLTGRFVERYLEWHPVYRGNHYVSNGVGLVYLGALFRDDPAGARWLRLGARILEREMARQVHADGVSFEAAIGYHRLVTEFFAWGGEVCRRNLPGVLSDGYWHRLRAMYRFIETYLDARGRAPLLGDADDGRLHHLCARAAAAPRQHRLGLPPRHWTHHPPKSAAFPQGGFYVLRAARDRCIVRCGAVGLAGAGSHDHNDQLSYELSLGGRELVTDSGTYAYTRDLFARYAFRATAAHNAVQVGEAEQNPLSPDRPWRVLADRTRAVCTDWQVEEDRVRFSGRHAGFATRPSGAVCHRTISVGVPGAAWDIEDLVEGQGAERLTWRLHLAPGTLGVLASASGRQVLSHDAVPEYRLELSAPEELVLTLEESLWSERYGVAVPRPLVVLRGTATLPARIRLRIFRVPRTA